MKVLIGCEFSGIVRNAFIAKGHDAMSCDLIKSETPGPHYKGDVLDVLYEGWDLAIFFPPCPYLTVTANKWYFHPDDQGLPREQRRPHPQFPDRQLHREQAVAFFMKLAEANIPKIAIENPIGIMSTNYRKPDQIIHPWQFGHGETKATCLWLKGLPLLKPTNIVEGRDQRIWKMPPSKERSKLRSKTFPGIAKGMADQWG